MSIHQSPLHRAARPIIHQFTAIYGLTPSDFVGRAVVDDDLVVLASRSPEVPNIGVRTVWRCFDPITKFVLRTDLSDLDAVEQGRGAWCFQIQFDDDGEPAHWFVLDSDGLRLNICRSQPWRHKEFNIHSVEHFPVRILIAASQSVCDVLPSIYPAAMRRRQSGAWVPYKGLPALIELRRLQGPAPDEPAPEPLSKDAPPAPVPGGLRTIGDFSRSFYEGKP